MLDSPAAVVRRMLTCFHSEGLSFEYAWSETMNRLPKPQSEPWEFVLERHSGVWAEFWQADDFEGETWVVVVALERICREVEIAARAK